MEIQKYITPSRVILKTDTYSCSVKTVHKLVEAAKIDFPLLKDCDIDIKIYNDDRWKGQMGIEFNVNGMAPSDYIPIRELPRTFN